MTKKCEKPKLLLKAEDHIGAEVQSGGQGVQEHPSKLGGCEHYTPFVPSFHTQHKWKCEFKQECMKSYGFLEVLVSRYWCLLAFIPAIRMHFTGPHVQKS